MSGYRKKLIEVGLPLVAINAESAREKSIRHGHPSTLHLWWARRPLAACRAVLFASLVDDPDSDPSYRRADGSVDEEAAGIKRAELFNLIEELVAWENSNNPDVIRSARAEIARCVASRKLELGELKADEEIAPGMPVKRFMRDCRCMPIFVGTEKSKKKTDKRRFSFGVSHLPAADLVDHFLAKHAPPVLDPFAGGGSIPLEAQRLGLRAHASDLNPVPVLINKALIEIPTRFAARPPVNPEARKGGGANTNTKTTLIEEEWLGAKGLAEDVRYYGKWLRDEAEKRLRHLYPKVRVTAEMAKDRPDLKPYVGEELTVIAWLWARTVASPNPAARGAHVPVVGSFYLSTKPGKEAWVEPKIDRANSAYRFNIRVGQAPRGLDPAQGTIGRAGGTCLLTSEPMSFDHIRSEAKAGRMGSRLMAVVADGGRGRLYLPPQAEHVTIAESAKPEDYPDTDLPQQALSMRVMLYGMDKHYKLFTKRQLVLLELLTRLVREARERVHQDAQAVYRITSNDSSLEEGGSGPAAYADAVATYLGFGVSKVADYNSNLVSWISPRDQARGTFSKQALPMIWDYCEVNPFVGAAGDYEVSLTGICKVIEGLPASPSGQVRQLDATASADFGVMSVISTDPPYYDNIGYADLSDYFYIWLRKSVGQLFPQLCSTLLTPKSQELIATPFRHNGSREAARDFFESGLGHAFERMRQKHLADFPLTVYYAFKQSEDDESSDFDGDTTTSASTGWETMLAGLIKSGFTIVGTWPVRTERGARSVGIGTNALASSIVLVCRPRPNNASLATRKEFITVLRRELPQALRNLQHGNIAPVDLAQSAIGPGMAVFTRFSKVLESDGSSMSVRTALGLINQTLDEVLTEQEGEFDADTRWALAWFEQFGMDEGPFGDAETLSKAKNTAINGLVDAGVIVAKSGKVRLIRRDELPPSWSPATDKRLTVWEVTQHLIQRLAAR